MEYRNQHYLAPPFLKVSLVMNVTEKGDVGSKAFYLQRYLLISGIFSEAASRFTHEVVTPRNLATSAPKML